jgi:hypothetical protein
LPNIWRQGLLTSVQKKTLLRALIDKVVVHRVGGHLVRRREKQLVTDDGHRLGIAATRPRDEISSYRASVLAVEPFYMGCVFIE